MDERALEQILERLTRLERAVFSPKDVKLEKRPNEAKHKGATGGIRLLINEGFFNKRRLFGEVCDAATARGYHYSKQAFQEALTRLATKEKALVTLVDKGKKVYAARK